MQGSNVDTDIENRLMDTVGWGRKGKWGAQRRGEAHRKRPESPALSVFTVTAREFLINQDTRRHDRQRHHDSTWLHSSGLRI